jgi:hypothetical protein
MKHKIIHLSPDECLQLKRGESIRVQFKDYILVLSGTKREKIKKL